MKMRRPQNQNHDATKATTTTTAGVALFIVVAVAAAAVVVVIIVDVLFLWRATKRRCRRCFGFDFVYFEFSQNFLEFLHSHTLAYKRFVAFHFLIKYRYTTHT